MTRTLRQRLQDVLQEAEQIETAAKARGYFTDDELVRVDELADEATDLRPRITRDDATHALVGRLASQQGADESGSTVGALGGTKTAPNPLAQAVLSKVTQTTTGKALLPAGPVATAVDLATIIALPQVPNALLALLSNDATLTGDSYKYLRQVSRNNQAAVTPYGETKPTSDYELTQVLGHVVTVAHLAGPYPVQWLADIPSISQLVNSELTYGLLYATEDVVLNGHPDGGVDDSGIDGILTTTGVQQQPFDTDAITTVRQAIGRVQDFGANVTAVALSPADDRAWDLAQDANQRYFGAGPFQSGPATAWGRPRVVSQRLPQGTAVVGDWSTVTLRQREPVTVLASTSSGDLFETNMTLVRGECRIGVQIAQPGALCVAELTETET